MSWIAQLAIALVVFAAGAASGIKWHAGQDAIAENARLVAAKVADDARQSDAIQQRKGNDIAAGQHAAALATVNHQLGSANAKIALLSGRQCFDAGTVGMLNAIGAPAGADDVRAPPGDPAGAPAAAAAGAGLRFATERDTAAAIATCRARYTEVASQINQILDIEDRRQAGSKKNISDER